MSEEHPLSSKDLMLKLRSEFGIRRSLQIMGRLRKRLSKEAKVRGRDSPMTEGQFLAIVDEEISEFVKEIAE